MDAKKALEITINSWIENEPKHLKYIAEFRYESKVEEAARAGRNYCTLGVIPHEECDFVAWFFENLGYWVIFQGVSPTEVSVRIDWHLIPASSRHYINGTKFINSLAESIKE